MTILNDTRYADYLSDIREYGRNSAKGKDSWPLFVIRTIQAAADQVFDEDKMLEVLTEFCAAEGKKLIHERKASSVKTRKSEMCKVHRAGSLTTVDMQAVINRAAELYAAHNVEEEKLKGSYQAYVDVCGAQLAQPDYELDDAQIMAAMLTNPKVSTVEQDLKAALKKIEAALKKQAELDATVTLESAEAAKRSLEAQIATLTRASEIAEARARLASLGVAA